VLIEKLTSRSFDERREIIIPGDAEKTLIFCVEHFLAAAHKAIQDHNAFFVALSGGSTPRALFEKLCTDPYKDMMQWNKIHLFWSDERAVPPTHIESNYHMALSSGFAKMSIPTTHIHRMCAEENIEAQAQLYEQEIQAVLGDRPFDLIMLGVGEDGHTASLFPGTEALLEEKRSVVANYVPQKSCWRMTFTYPCINAAKQTAIYALGASKKQILKEVFTSQNGTYPVQKVGTPTHKSLWIADVAAAEGLSTK
jgi:6-phosphogluconolactonase